MKKTKVKDMLFLHVVLFIYAIAMLFSKKASSFEFMSSDFILYYGIMILIMGVYALTWQQVLKKTPLNIAFANKSVTVIWGLVFGYILYKETISISMIIGIGFIICGIILVVINNE